MFWCQTVKSTTTPAATSLQTVSCWQFSFPAVSGVSQTRASWPSTLWLHTTWGRCSTPRDSVQFLSLFGFRLRPCRGCNNLWRVCLHRSERHLCQLVSDGLLRDGGPGLSQDPAASHHWPHGGASLPPAAATRRRDFHEGETAQTFYVIVILMILS